MKKNSRINLLSESVIEKIAAGEVIERPASVLKELIENSLDAGSTKIDINIENGGFSFISISDNGIGMSESDISKSVIRHCTSKITSADDLYSVSTMGFRGEALASISAVSRLSIESSDNNDGLGWQVETEGGKVSSPTPISRKRGTSVVCRDLFFNVPARKKFMKSEKAEKMGISRIVEQLVVPFPSVHFTYSADGKRILDLPAVNEPIERIAQLTGVDFASAMIKCTSERDDMSATVYISDPQDAKQRPRYQNLYANLRRVDNDAVSNAVREAYKRFIMSHLKASWFCFLDIDPKRVDVNVHPTKQKIKFDDEKAVFSFIFATVKKSISEAIDVRGSVEYDSSYRNTDNFFSNNGFVEETKSVGNFGILSNNKSNLEGSPDEVVRQISIPFITQVDLMEEDKQPTFEDAESDKNSENKNWNLISCYQIHKMYIVTPVKDGIIIIDQHAAHERVLYEEALRDLESGKGESQRLLFPVNIEMTAAEKEVVFENREFFNKIGFDVRDFGGSTVAVSSIPAGGFFAESDIEETIREMVDNLINEKDPEILSKPEKKFAASFACGAAIKFGKELKTEEMNALLNSLFSVVNPNICPHGRPTFIRVTLNELTRRFLR